jgi:hypothetical protein
MKGPRGGRGERRPRAFPPSLAGACLRNATMELLGFGRRISAESRERMAAGSALHREFQAELLASGRLIAAESPVRDEALQVSGRLDALLEGQAGPVVVEYKTVGPERFSQILEEGTPPVTFWAQLVLYLAVTGHPEGRLVIDSREVPRRRLMFRLDAGSPWEDWVRARVRLAREWADHKRLPPREPGTHCLSCDRWERCYRTVEERDAQVAAHPRWAPDPPLLPLAVSAEES